MAVFQKSAGFSRWGAQTVLTGKMPGSVGPDDELDALNPQHLHPGAGLNGGVVLPRAVQTWPAMEAWPVEARLSMVSVTMASGPPAGRRWCAGSWG